MRSAAGMAANDDYLAGDQQMKLAAFMKVGFACIDATLPTYTLYRPATVPEEGCYFALIRVGLMGGRHSEPLATHGDTQCSLLLRGEACALLQQRGFHEVALERSEAGPNLDGSGVANGADWAAASARRSSSSSAQSAHVCSGMDGRADGRAWDGRTPATFFGLSTC